MPLYEYECDSCGHRFEVIQRYSDPLIDKCPRCGSTVHKLISSPAIQFKGSGFYITDYPKNESGAPKSSGGKDKEGSSSAESSSDKGGEKGGGKASDTASEEGGSDKGSDKGAEKSAGKSGEKSAEKSSDKKSDKTGSGGSTSSPTPAATKKD
jgi:putative FmdB family regulatory protein